MPIFRRKPTETITAHTPLRPPDWKLGKRDAPTKVEPVRRRLERLLAILAARTETHEFNELHVQPIIQVHVNQGDSYTKFRRHWNERLRSVPPRGRLHTETWVEELPDHGWASILVPSFIGVTSLAATAPMRTPKALKGQGRSFRPTKSFKPAADPLYAAVSHHSTIRITNPTLTGMELLGSWFEWTPADATVLAAPPIFEYVNGTARHVFEAEVITWDLPWPLSPAELGEPASARE